MCCGEIKSATTRHTPWKGITYFGAADARARIRRDPGVWFAQAEGGHMCPVDGADIVDKDRRLMSWSKECARYNGTPLNPPWRPPTLSMKWLRMSHDREKLLGRRQRARIDSASKSR